MITAQPLTAASFAPFGDVIATGADPVMINNGTTERHHDLAKVDVLGQGAHTLINIFRGQPFTPPVEIRMMERHPLGSQAFMPLSDLPYLVVVAQDDDGAPGWPVAFLAEKTGVNYRANVWHHPLISLEAVSDFLVVDRGGEGVNLEEADIAPVMVDI